MAKLTTEELAAILWFVNECGCHEINGAGLLDHIDALQSELDENRWRYVADGELPEVHEEVFWTRKKGSVIVGTRFNQMHIECEERMHALSEMRAWRPLPKPAPEREPQCPGST